MATKKASTKRVSSVKAGKGAGRTTPMVPARAARHTVETGKAAKAATLAAAAATPAPAAAERVGTLVHADKPEASRPAKESLELDGLRTADLARLRMMNIWLALILGVQAAAILLFGGTKTTPVTVQYVAADHLASQVTGHTVWAAATRQLFDMRLSITSAKALIVLALTALVLATVGRAYYETQLRRGSHLARWLSFGLGGGLMMIALAQISGFTDITLFALMLVLTAIGFSLHPVADRMRREGRAVLAHAVCAAAIIAVVAPWAVLAAGAAGALLWDGHLAATTYAMYATTALFFVCWALAGYFRGRRQGRWADTLYAEKMYMFLTLAASSMLAWQIFAGAL